MRGVALNSRTRKAGAASDKPESRHVEVPRLVELYRVELHAGARAREERATVALRANDWIEAPWRHTRPRSKKGWGMQGGSLSVTSTSLEKARRHSQGNDSGKRVKSRIPRREG